MPHQSRLGLPGRARACSDRITTPWLSRVTRAAPSSDSASDAAASSAREESWMGPEREPPTDQPPNARVSRNSAAGESEKPGGADAAAMPT
eukprot:3658479-Alexandrium_andersonii.AAC.1